MAQLNIRPVPSCTECGLESAGRCPTCHHFLCMDHFGLTEHQPCAARLAAHADDYICYVCAQPVRPQQWSTTVFSHYVDTGKCEGCDRYICDLHHTYLRDEGVEIVRDGLRSQRYHVTRRYCGLCSPVRHLGGIVGTTRWVALLAVLAMLVYFVLQTTV